MYFDGSSKAEKPISHTEPTSNDRHGDKHILSHQEGSEKRSGSETAGDFLLNEPLHQSSGVVSDAVSNKSKYLVPGSEESLLQDNPSERNMSSRHNQPLAARQHQEISLSPTEDQTNSPEPLHFPNAAPTTEDAETHDTASQLPTIAASSSEQGSLLSHDPDDDEAEPDWGLD